MFVPRLCVFLFLTALFISCKTDDSDIPEPSDFQFREDIIGTWIYLDQKWGIQIEKPGTIEFLVLDNRTASYISYTERKDSIILVDSTTLIFEPVNCLFDLHFSFFQTLDSSRYSMQGDTLSLELLEEVGGEVMKLDFVKASQVSIERNLSLFRANIQINDRDPYSFEGTHLMQNAARFSYDESTKILSIESVSASVNCVPPNRRPNQVINLGIKNFQGPGEYQLFQYSPDKPRMFEMSSYTEYSSIDVSNGYWVSGSILITDFSESYIKGSFSASLYLTDEKTKEGLITDGEFEVHK